MKFYRTFLSIKRRKLAKMFNNYLHAKLLIEDIKKFMPQTKTIEVPIESHIGNEYFFRMCTIDIDKMKVVFTVNNLIRAI